MALFLLTFASINRTNLTADPTQCRASQKSACDIRSRVLILNRWKKLFYFKDEVSSQKDNDWKNGILDDLKENIYDA